MGEKFSFRCSDWPVTLTIEFLSFETDKLYNILSSLVCVMYNMLCICILDSCILSSNKMHLSVTNKGLYRGAQFFFILFPFSLTCLLFSLFASSGCQFGNRLPFSHYLRHGFCSESEDVEANRVNVVFNENFSCLKNNKHISRISQ